MTTPDEWESDHCCCEKHKDAEPHQLVYSDGGVYVHCLHCDELFFLEKMKHLKYIMVD